jgi:hypothetical protein
MTPLDELSARNRNLYLTSHNTHNRQKSMPPVGSEPAIPAGERPETHALKSPGHWERPLFTTRFKHLRYVHTEYLGPQ